MPSKHRDRRNHDLVKCKATSKITGNQCAKYAIPGGTVCRHHGGNAPQVRRVAEARVAERKAEEALNEALGQLHITPVGDPLSALQQLAGEILSWKELAAERTAKLRTVGYSGKYGEQIRAEVLVFERALDRAAMVLATIARLDIDQRLAQITMQQKQMIIRALEAGLASAGVAGPAAETAKQVAGRHLRSVA